ncbi:MAG: hypothetical protein JKY56_19765 [Kofleriaceae bacterium]|nr:hypothetical protein [Kofleriaceae bacterium]
MKAKILLLAVSLVGSFSLAACQPKQTPVKKPTLQQDAATEKPLGTKPVLDADGMPQNCEVMVAGLCYIAMDAACAAAQCPMEHCLILESYPGQVSCQAAVDIPANATPTE